MTAPAPHRVPRSAALPGYIHHPAFVRPGSAEAFDPYALLATPPDPESRYMPDEVTREHARRMHYAAARAHAARTRTCRGCWMATYYALRDRIVLGNRKLIYRAVRRRMAGDNRADDVIGDCHIVLIQVVAAFNPWLDVRFSTYAYTCLVRAMSRASRRLASDRLARALPFDVLPDGEPRGRDPLDTPASSGTLRLDEFLRAGHPLLSDREKAVVSLRFPLADGSAGLTLEEVGRGVGLSKERVRQVQESALGKLRGELAPPPAGQ